MEPGDEMLFDAAGILRIAAGYVSAVQLDVTRPVEDAFRVRVYADGYPPPHEDIVAAFLLYGATVTGVARRIQWEWIPLRGVCVPYYHSLDYSGGFSDVLRTLDEPQGRFPP